jgi:poly-gamma-glutamate capsule biosynthesis protein CapA/YwtB (metallophosphatase superfamily)
VQVELFRNGAWRPAGKPVAQDGGVADVRASDALGRQKVRARGADGVLSPERRIRVRPLLLAAVGDINLGDGPGDAIARLGPRYPWESVGPRLKAADIAFGNLECAVSTRGLAQVKQYTFRGRPSSVAAMRHAAGIDVVNLANNHSGDFGHVALMDTLRALRANGIVGVGAGYRAASAYRPQIVERLGLRVAFVGFSAILPFAFRAGPSTPGSAWAFPESVRASVRAARRRADVVIATFHWGVERQTYETATQRSLAAIALEAGATAIIGAHPHVLEPVRRPPHRLIAYSLGNFVFSAASPGTQNTGILEVRLARGRVLGSHLVRAHIVASRPVLGTR